MCVSFPDPTAGVWAVAGHVNKQHVGKKMKPYEVIVISKELKRRTTKMNQQSDH